MEWLNLFGLIFVAVILIPNIIFAAKCKDGFENKYKNKFIEIIEQTGRFGCFGFMIFNIPGTCWGFPGDEAFALYLIIDASLSVLYCALYVSKKKQCFQGYGAFNYSLCHVFIQRYNKPFASFDAFGTAVCAEPYSHFVQKCCIKQIAPFCGAIYL